MIKKIFLFICLLLFGGITGCSDKFAEQKKVEELLIKNNYFVNVAEDYISVEKYYNDDLGKRSWMYSDATDSNLLFGDECYFGNLHIDPVDGCFVITHSEQVLTHESGEKMDSIKKFSDNELSKIGISYDDLKKYMVYKIEEDPNSVGKQYKINLEMENPKLAKAIEVENNYNQMLLEIDKSQSNSITAKEGIWYYMNIGYRMNELIDNINGKSNDLDVNNVFNDIFGYYPKDNKEAMARINEFQKTVIWDPEFYHIHTTAAFILENDNVESFIDDSDTGYMIIKDLDKFLKEKRISAKTLSNLLGVFKDYAAEIYRNQESIIIEWSNYTRGYDYCAPKNQDVILSPWMKKYAEKGQMEFKEIKNGTGHISYIIKNPDNLNFRYISMYIRFYNQKNRTIDVCYKKVKNVSGSKIVIPLECENAKYDEYVNYNYFICSMLN